MVCEEAVYLSYILIAVEFYHRWNLNLYDETKDEYIFFQQKFQLVYVIFLLVSLIFSILHHYNSLPSFLSHPVVIYLIPYFYLTDSIAALFLGYAFYERNIANAIFSMQLLSNLFLLSVINRTFAPSKGRFNLWYDIVGTSKQYLHHSANFLFLHPSDKNTIIWTSLWRALSMTGHAAQLLHFKKYIDSNTLYKFNWLLSHLRNGFVICLILALLFSTSLRQGFGRSAVGHIVYILLRGGPVFRLGSVYVGDRVSWQLSSDYQKIKALLQGYHPYLTVEVGLLFILAFLLFYCRFTVDRINPFAII